MKAPSILIAAILTIFVVSCSKDHDSLYDTHKPTPTRKVRYELFTKEDFSTDQHNITFNLFMRNSRINLLDSPLATMKISAIPDSLHKIVIEKTVPGNDTTALVVGFTYYIENVGYSWNLDSFPARDTFKLIQYSFR
jgi:hypothetical protein